MSPIYYYPWRREWSCPTEHPRFSFPQNKKNIIKLHTIAPPCLSPISNPKKKDKRQRDEEQWIRGFWDSTICLRKFFPFARRPPTRRGLCVCVRLSQIQPKRHQIITNRWTEKLLCVVSITCVCGGVNKFSTSPEDFSSLRIFLSPWAFWGALHRLPCTSRYSQH